MSFGLALWLFVLAVALHNTEEAIWLPRWSRSAGHWHRAVAQGEFRFAVVALTVLAVFAAALASLQGAGSVGAYLVSGYALAMLLNVIFPHTLATLVLRRYMPGLATAWLGILPTSAALLWKALHEGAVEPGRFWIVGPIIVAGILASIPALFWAGRKAERTLFAAVRHPHPKHGQ